MRKHIVCLGDSNTHGYCADPMDCADHGDRFNEDERWTCLLQEKLGRDYLVLEEGLSGRTTVFEDALHESMPAVDVAYPILMSHEPVRERGCHRCGDAAADTESTVCPLLGKACPENPDRCPSVDR